MQGIQTLPYEVKEEELVPSGGIQTFKKAANMLADFGRHGDVYVIHAAEGEAVIPLKVLDENPRMKRMIFQQMEDMGLDPQQYIVGDVLNSVNPVTGVREFGWFSKVFKKIKKIIKKIAPIVLPLIAPYLLPMMPIAFATGIGSLAGGLIAGQSVGDALKGAIISGGLAGLGNMAFRGETFMGGSFFGSTANPMGTLADVSWKDAFTNIQNPFANVGATAGAKTPEDSNFWTGETTPPSQDSLATKMAAPPAPRPGAVATTEIGPSWSGQEGTYMWPGGEPGVTNLSNVPVPPGSGETFMGGAANTPQLPAANTPQLPDNRNWFERNVWNPADSTAGGINSQDALLESYISPNRASLQSTPSDIGKSAAAAERSYVAGGGTLTPDISTSMYKTAAKAAEPGMFKTYAPLAATAIGAGAASDLAFGTNFVMGEDADGDGFDDVTGRKLYEEDPGRYAFGRGFYGDNPYYQDDTFVPIDVRNQATATVAGGGSIEGPGTPTSDSIPAMLSDGEFVMNASAVRGAGQGDRTEGARRMYAMMREFEGRA